MQLLDAGRHLLGGRDEQRAQPDRGGVVLDGGVDDRRDRHLLAEVDDRVAVVGQDRVDQRLADVVDVAEHGREHDRALGVALELVQVRSSWATARFITSADWSTNGRISSPAPNLSPTSFIAGSSTSLSVGHGADLLDAAVDPVLDALLLAAQDVEVQRLLGLHPLGRVGLLGLGLGLALGLEVGDEPLERVLAAVEHEVVGELALVLGDLAVRGDVVRVDHRQVEPGLDAVVQEHAVEHAAGGQADAEADVRDAERGLDAGDLRLDQADPLDRLDRARPPLLVAGRQRERQAVEDQRLGVEPVLVAAQLR